MEMICLEFTDDKFKVYKQVNLDAIDAKGKELEKYPGELPSILYDKVRHLYRNHPTFLDQQGLLDDDLAWKLCKTRKAHRTPNEEVEELRIWVKDNPEFKDFLIEE